MIRNKWRKSKQHTHKNARTRFKPDKNEIIFSKIIEKSKNNQEWGTKRMYHLIQFGYSCHYFNSIGNFFFLVCIKIFHRKNIDKNQEIIPDCQAPEKPIWHHLNIGLDPVLGRCSTWLWFPVLRFDYFCILF